MLGGDLNAVELESVNIHEILDHVNNLVVAENMMDQKKSLGSDGSSSRKVKIIKAYQPPIVLKGDKSQLTQIFLNLLRNAVQALEGEGEILIETRVGYKTAIGSEVFNRVAEIRVIDDGRGVGSQTEEFNIPSSCLRKTRWHWLRFVYCPKACKG